MSNAAPLMPFHSDHIQFGVIRGRWRCAVLFILFTLFACLDHCSPAFASTQDAVQQYNEHKYEDARRMFEADMSETWNDPTFAYCYALTLKALDKTEEAIKVCQQIAERFPQHQVTQLARQAVVHWSKIQVLGDMPLTYPNIGILGFKFVCRSGGDPRVSIIFADTPAKDAGLAVGDLILSVDNLSTKDLSKKQVFELLAGAPGTDTHLSIRRDNDTVNLTIKRMRSEDFAKLHPERWSDYQRNTEK